MAGLNIAEGFWASVVLFGVLLSLLPATGLPAPSVARDIGISAQQPKPPPTQLSFLEDMIAGAFARVAAQCVMYPADALKTLAQVRDGNSAQNFQPSMLIRGSISTSMMALPAGAIQFSMFPLMKRWLRTILPSWVSITFIEMVASATASLLSCIFQSPQELLKQRIQTGLYPSFIQGMKTLTVEEGVAGWFTGFVPTVARNMPMVVVVFTTFARLKALHKHRTGRDLTGRESVAVGGLAGAVAVSLTQPVDVVKTRLMTQAVSDQVPYRGVVDCVRRIATEEGLLTLYSGLLPRLLYIAPFSAIQFSVNAKMRDLLLWRHRRKDNMKVKGGA